MRETLGRWAALGFVVAGCSSGAGPEEQPPDVPIGVAREGLVATLFPVADDVESGGTGSKRWGGADTDVPVGYAGQCDARAPDRNRTMNLRFKLSSIPACATVSSATLTFSQTGCTVCQSALTLDLYRITGGPSASWTGSAVPGGPEGPGVGLGDPSVASSLVTTPISVPAPGLGTGAQGTFAYTVTSDVQAWVTGTASNYGWQLWEQNRTPTATVNCPPATPACGSTTGGCGGRFRRVFTSEVTPATSPPSSAERRPTLVVTYVLNNAACTDTNPCTADTCTATGCTHPAGNANATCRTSAGVCDPAEKCTGTSTACPADVKSPNGTVCRSAAGECDVAETCNGTLSTCPADAKKPSGTACTPDALVCTADQCDGTGVTCTHPAIPGCLSWGGASQLDGGTLGAANPQIAINSVGDAMAVWPQYDGTRYNIWARRYVHTTGWAAATLIETDDTGAAQYPQVATDGNGNAICVWEQSDGTRFNIMANRFTPAGNWSGAVPLELAAGDAHGPVVAMDSTGRATASWSQIEGASVYRVWANRFSGTAWSGASALEATPAAISIGPSVAQDPSGAAVVVWERQEAAGSHFALWAARYSTAWAAPVTVDGPATDDAFQPRVALDGLGNGVVVYYRMDSSFTDHLWAARFTVSGGWSPASMIETAFGDAANPRVALNASGDGVAVWELVAASGGVRARRFSASTGWGTTTLVNAAGGTANQPSVAVDGAGNAIVVWRQGGTPIRVVSNQMSSTGVWGAPTNVDSTAQTSFAPQMALNATGAGVAVWYQVGTGSSVQHVWANHVP